MVFACDNCHFIFSRTTQPELCPDCGKYAVRPANEEEIMDFQRQINGEKNENAMRQMPDFCETTINQIDYFTLLLPVTAFGFQDDMMLELSVEYFSSEDNKQYLANVWARQKGASTKQFIFPAAVPVCAEPETAIIEEINSNEVFQKLMHDFICETAKHRCD